MRARAYRDKDGSLLYVDALSNDGMWYTTYKRRYTPGVGYLARERVTHTNLPVVCSRREAQRDLDAYARRHGLETLDVDWAASSSRSRARRVAAS
jgi:hypothetical protein